jgi:hypothetical protein
MTANRRTCSISWLLAAVLVTPSTAASAAPPVEPTPTPVDEENQKIDRAQELFALGESTFHLGQYNSTIELWEEAYALLPTSMRAERAELQVSLADVHRRAHEKNPDPEHLRAAQRLYTDYLDAVDVDDPARVEIEAELEAVSTELAELEAELARIELAAAAAKAATESARAAGETEAEAALSHYKAERAEDQRRARVGIERKWITGGLLIGIGTVSVGTMVAGLALGADADRRGQEVAPERPVNTFDAAEQRRQLTILLRDGTTYNQIAWTSGIIGGALLISGTMLLVVATLQHERSNTDRHVRLHPGPSGLEVRF